MVVTPRRPSKLGISSVTDMRDDDGEIDIVVDDKNDGQKRQFFSDDDIKSCPFPFNCFNKKYLFYHVTNDATGIVIMECARSIASLSNVFYATGLLYLAQKYTDEGCEGQEQHGLDLSSTSDESSNTCNDGKILGFEPVSLVTNVWTFSGLLSALFLPYVGSLLDHTKYRWECGLAVSVCIVLIQTAQIGTTEDTWLVMAVLEAFNGFLFQINLLCSTAYVTEVQEQVPADKYTKINTIRFLTGFTNSIVLLIIIVAAGYIWDFDGQHIAQFSQAVGSVMMFVYFYLSWYFLGKRGAVRVVPEGESLATAGLKQMVRTGKGLFQYYSRSVFVYFIGTSFTSAGIDGLTVIIVTYLKVSLHLESTQIAITIAIVLLSCIPGGMCAHWLASKFTPIAALKFALLYTIVLNICVFEWLEEGMFFKVCISAIGWGLGLGMHSPLRDLVFSIIVPKGQEAELSGFFTYCLLALSWVLPLGTTILNEYSDLKWVGALTSGCTFIGLIFMSVMLPWDECIDAAKDNLMQIQSVPNMDDNKIDMTTTP